MCLACKLLVRKIVWLSVTDAGDARAKVAYDSGSGISRDDNGQPVVVSANIRGGKTLYTKVEILRIIEKSIAVDR